MSAVDIFASLNGQRFKRRGTVLTREVFVEDHTVKSKITTPAPADTDLAAWWLAYLEGRRAVATKPTNRTLRVIDIFSGVGGLSLGFRQAAEECGMGVHSVVAADQDLGALNVYRRNHKTDMIISESVSMLVNYQLLSSDDGCKFFSEPTVAPRLSHLSGSIDAILAGPPCQGHSNLNNHSRRDDDRNELYLSVPAMAVALQVPIVIIENVPGVVHDHRSVVNTTISLLRNCGYEVTCGTLAAHHMGWPQTRKRFFLIATKGFAPVGLESVSGALHVGKPLSVSWALERVQKRGSDNFMDEVPRISSENQRRVNFLFENNLHDLPNAERPECHREGTTYKSVYGRMRAEKPAPTLTGGFLSPGRGRFTHPTEPRALTPREAARLQGFPQNYDFRPGDDIRPGRTEVARWIGNAVPMPLGYAAGLCALLPIVALEKQRPR